MITTQQQQLPWEEGDYDYLFWHDEEYDYCRRRYRRYLEDDSPEETEIWKIVYTCLVLAGLLVGLVSDKYGADSLLLLALTLFLAAEIITVQEALVGFSNSGLWTVLVLLVIADGIHKTGALDWYIPKWFLGRPKTVYGAQLRLMVPVAIVSAFLNNTPVVAVLIPIIQKWATQLKISQKQLLIPLSFASILGGTCTLIGTSTNLVVAGLLQENFPDSPEIGLFDLGIYGVPVAMAGTLYILLVSPFLLPNGKYTSKSGDNNDDQDEDASNILLGARLTPWSPAASRTILRSGLRDTGGIFLVSVHRAATGNVHRAVSNDFVLNVGDILYFTGLIESFGNFCQEHGLEVITNEIEQSTPSQQAHHHDDVPSAPEFNNNNNDGLLHELDNNEEVVTAAVPQVLNLDVLPTVQEEDDHDNEHDERLIGCTKESLLHADPDEKLRSINRMTDLIRNSNTNVASKQKLPSRHDNMDKIVVTLDDAQHLVVVGINAHDRPGLLLDIAKGLLRFHLQLHHTEAAVVGDRSVSIWRCEAAAATADGEGGDDHDLLDIEEIWSVLSALLSDEHGVEAIKQRGLRVIRARVVKHSQLIGKTAAEVDFRKTYKAAIVAVQQQQQIAGGGNSTTSSSLPLSSIRFAVNDTLILQASDDSPLLQRPPDDFYNATSTRDVLAAAGTPAAGGTMSRTSSVGSFVRKLTGRKNSMDLESADDNNSRGVNEQTNSSPVAAVERQRRNSDEEGFFIPSDDEENDEKDISNSDTAEILNLEEAMANAEQADLEQAAWRDLRVSFRDEGEEGGVVREFLTAMAVAPHSQLAGKSAVQAGIHKLPDLFLVSIDRPRADDEQVRRHTVLADLNDSASVDDNSGILGSVRTENRVFDAVHPEDPLKKGDILWFSGPAFAVGDLRKIPGLVSYQNEEVEKINSKVFDRRLVQAVVARKGPLVGKTVKEVRFRTRYGAAVIAVHREGKRVHEHPGNVKLQAGVVLLLEAGQSFVAKSAENDRSFALLAEVENSAPPRLSLLLPALLITAGMLAVFMAGLTSLLVSSLVAAILMVALGILSEQEARDAINWEVYITIASAFGIGTALVNSGVADAVANFLVDVGTGMGIGDAGLLGSVYFATFLISNVVTNNAAAALLFPIAMNAAEQTGTDRMLMSYSLMLGASASFMSPFGYTTNLLIYGPGGYKYNDFLKFGTPQTLFLLVLTTLFLSVIEPWWISWIATGACLAVVTAAHLFGTSSVTKLFRGKDSGDASSPPKAESAVKARTWI